MKLYKYMKPEHADGLIQKGNIRIGTLYEYRDSEDERADRLEGERHYTVERQVLNTSDNSSETKYARDLGLGPGNFLRNNIGATVRNTLVSSDSYIYCTSMNFDNELLQKFGGACIEIQDPYSFFKTIDMHLQKNGLVIGKLDPVGAKIIYCPQDKYYSYLQDTDKKEPGWIIKPYQYRDEKEFRSQWESTQETDLMPPDGTRRKDYEYTFLKPLIEQIPELQKLNSFSRIA